MKNFCSYGCEKLAVHQFKNGKYCCSLSKNQCSAVIEFNRIKNTGRKQPDGTGEKISKRLKGRIPWNKNVTGYHVSIDEETKKRMRERRQGKPSSMLGKHHSIESKSKISSKNKGKIRTKEQRKKYSLVNIGKIFTEERKKKMSVSALKRCTYEWREQERQKMLKGKSSYINSFNK